MNWLANISELGRTKWDKTRFTIVLSVFFLVLSLAGVSLFAFSDSGFFDNESTVASTGGSRNLASKPNDVNRLFANDGSSIFSYDQPWSRRFVTTHLDLGGSIANWHDYAEANFGRLSAATKSFVRRNKYFQEDNNALYDNLALETGWHPLYLYNQSTGTGSTVALADADNGSVSFASGQRDFRTASVSSDPDDGNPLSEKIDVAPVPLPAGIFLLGPAIALLGFMRKKS